MIRAGSRKRSKRPTLRSSAGDTTVRMAREFSAGGVLVRRLRGRWVVAAIRPEGKPPGVWALPKGRIDDGERAEATALREVAEETGAQGRSLGRLGDIPEAFRHEVAEVQWLPLDEAPNLLAYRGEREMAEKAAAALDGQNV